MTQEIKLPEPNGTVVDPTFVQFNQQYPYGTEIYTASTVRKLLSERDAEIDRWKTKYSGAMDVNTDLRAEVERLKSIPMKYKRMSFNAQLQDDNCKLRDRATFLDESNAILGSEIRQLKAKLAQIEQAEPIGYVIKDSNYIGSIIREQGRIYSEPVYLAAHPTPAPEGEA